VRATARDIASRIIPHLVVLYAIVLLVVLTQGPVYRMWGESAIFLQFAPEPSIPHAYFATFVAVQLPATLWWWRHVRQRDLTQPALIALGVFLGWLGLSVLWSTLARQSLPEYISLVLTTGAGLFLATRFNAAELWRIIGTAMGIGLAASLFAAIRRWELSVDLTSDYLIGIYYNRNSLAPVAAVALIAALGIVFNQTDTRRVWRSGVVVAALVLVLSAVVVLWRTESRTSPLALGVAFVATLLWLGARWSSSRSWCPKSISRSLRTGSATLSLVVTSLAVFVSLRFVTGLSSISGETSTFNSRGPLWSLSWSGFLEKPLHGWGWMAAWRTPDFFRQGTWWAVWQTEWSHNGYHDLLLGGGVPAVVAFGVMIWFASRQISAQHSLRSAVPQFVTIVFVLAAATQESFFIGSHFLWAVLIATLFAGRQDPLRSVDEQHTRHVTP
jgi:O-antigen ligase